MPLKDRRIAGHALCSTNSTDLELGSEIQFFYRTAQSFLLSYMQIIAVISQQQYLPIFRDYFVRKPVRLAFRRAFEAQ